MHRLIFSIKTLSPIVLTASGNSTVMTKTHSTFSGSIIRGVLASRFVEVQKLGKAAHEDSDFREIFYDKIKFLPASPEIKNQRSFVFPKSLQRGKAGTPDGDKVKDLLATDTAPRGYKTFGGLGVLVDKKFYTAQVRMNIFMHMSRNGDSERLAGRSVDGNIYNYESIDAGQIFGGEILGEEKTLRKLIDGLNLDGGKMIAYVGRSRFTQYGKCLVTFGEIEKLPAQNFSDKIFLRLETPLIPAEDNFLSAKKILEAEVVDKLGEKFSLGKVFASAVEVENFVVPWSIKRPRVTALAVGSVFELKLSAALNDDEKNFLAEKLFDGFGTRREEGFGQLRLWSPAEFTVGKLDDEKISKPEKFSKQTIQLAKKILQARLLETVRVYAHEDAEDLRKQLRRRGNMTHFFSRLDTMSASLDKKNLRQNFAARLTEEIRDGSQFQEHLKNLYMANGQKFFDVLTGHAPLPHEIHDLLKESGFEKIRDEIKFTEEDFSDDEFFSEYLTNYFRFARKIAAASKGGESHE